MRLHDNSAVLHYVMFAVAFVFFLKVGVWGEGGGGARVWSSQQG